MWLCEKFKLGLGFPNLPYYIDGNFKLTQSSAILEYIADKHDLISNCKKQRGVLHMFQNAVSDLRSSFTRMCHNPEFENQKGSFLKGLPNSLKVFEEYSGHKIWLTGDEINYPDFSLCEILNQLEKLEPSCLCEFPNLKAYLTLFENLPALKYWMASKELKTRSCYLISAKWRGDS